MCTHIYNTHAHTPLQTRTFTHPQLPPHTPGLHPFSTKLFSPSVNILQKWKVISLLPICKRNVFSLCSQADGVLLGASSGAKAPNSPLQWRGVPLIWFPSIDQSEKRKISHHTRLCFLSPVWSDWGPTTKHLIRLQCFFLAWGLDEFFVSQHSPVCETPKPA